MGRVNDFLGFIRAFFGAKPPEWLKISPAPFRDALLRELADVFCVWD
jgi:hypothetical protein